MGSDFGLMRFPAPPGPFPCRPPAGYDGPTPSFTELLAVRDLLIEKLAFRPNGPTGESKRSYWRDTPDGGSLCVRLDESWISIDTHSHWRFVQQVHDLVRTVHPDTVVADPQSGELHDSVSFDAFVKSNDAGQGEAPGV